MLKVLLFPFHLLKAIWRLFSFLIAALCKLAVELERFAENAEKASERYLQDERARRQAENCKSASIAQKERERSEASTATAVGQPSLPEATRVIRYPRLIISTGPKTPQPDKQETQPSSGSNQTTVSSSAAAPLFVANRRQAILDVSEECSTSQVDLETKWLKEVNPPPFGIASPPSAESTTAPVEFASVQLILFDLDGTLLRTADLERFRGRTHLDAQPDAYIDELTEAFYRDASRWIYSQKQMADLITACSGVKFGIFTRSPGAYAACLLDLAFPRVKWDVVIAFEDVRRSKPYGEGILRAMKLTRVADLQSVILVGDDTTDIQAAYNAGCLAFLETSGWMTPNKLALEKIPDAKVRGPQSLLHAIRSIPERLPALECALLNQPIMRRSTRFDSVRHDGPDGEKLIVHVAGRLFVDSPELATRRLFHRMTKSILDNKNSSDFPNSWISVLSAFLRGQLTRYERIVVTIIPAKPGRVPRLERLLAQLENQLPELLRKRCQFIPDVLTYEDEAASHSGGHLSRRERMVNARLNLRVNRPKSVSGCDIVVIDDVVTSGATLLAADSRLTNEGARSVTCTALAKSVRFS